MSNFNNLRAALLIGATGLPLDEGNDLLTCWAEQYADPSAEPYVSIDNASVNWVGRVACVHLRDSNDTVIRLDVDSAESCVRTTAIVLETWRGERFGGVFRDLECPLCGSRWRV